MSLQFSGKAELAAQTLIKMHCQFQDLYLTMMQVNLSDADKKATLVALKLICTEHRACLSQMREIPEGLAHNPHNHGPDSWVHQSLVLNHTSLVMTYLLPLTWDDRSVRLIENFQKDEERRVSWYPENMRAPPAKNLENGPDNSLVMRLPVDHQNLIFQLLGLQGISQCTSVSRHWEQVCHNLSPFLRGHIGETLGASYRKLMSHFPKTELASSGLNNCLKEFSHLRDHSLRDIYWGLEKIKRAFCLGSLGKRGSNTYLRQHLEVCVPCPIMFKALNSCLTTIAVLDELRASENLVAYLLGGASRQDEDIVPFLNLGSADLGLEALFQHLLKQGRLGEALAVADRMKHDSVEQAEAKALVIRTLGINYPEQAWELASRELDKGSTRTSVAVLIFQPPSQFKEFALQKLINELAEVGNLDDAFLAAQFMDDKNAQHTWLQDLLTRCGAQGNIVLYEHISHYIKTGQVMGVSSEAAQEESKGDI